MATGLVVIDVQRGMFMLPLPPHRGARVIDEVVGLLARARNARAPVFFIRHDGGPGHVLARGDEGWNFQPPVLPDEGEAVIEKQNSSAFHGTDLHERLRRAAVDTIVIAGMQTEYCIDSAVRAAVALEYRVLLPADAHTTFYTSLLSASQIIAHHNLTLGDGFAAVVPAADIRF